MAHLTIASSPFQLLFFLMLCTVVTVVKGAFAGVLHFTTDKADIKPQNVQFKDRELTEEPL